MRRREFFALLGGAPMAWPSVATAQKVKRLGFFGSSTSAAMAPWTAAFVRRLAELGWIDGRDFVIDYRFAEGRSDRYREIVEGFVRQNVDVIVTYGTPPTKAAMDATADIPIVFAAAADPVAAGLVASLARPGGERYRAVASTE